MENVRSISPHLLLAALLVMLTACGGSSDEGPRLSDLPLYPNAHEVAAIQNNGFGGMMAGDLKQYATDDNYDDVLRFYRSSLTGYQTKEIEHTSQLGRQTAISIQKENGTLTVAVQEFTEEAKVHVTLMELTL